MGMAAGGIAGYGDGDDVSRRTNDGMAQGGMYDFAQRSEPVVRMAKGGIAHFVIGGEVKDEIDRAYAAGDYGRVNELAQENKITAADVTDTYKGFDTSGLAGLGINLFTPPAAQAQSQTVAAAPTYTQYTDAQIGSFLSNPVNQNIDINKAIVDTNADPAAVNRYIASLTSPFVGSTETGRGSGTFGIYNQFVGSGISPDEYYTAATANDPKYAGWTKDMIQEAYNLNKGMYALSDAKKGVVTDTDWARLMVGNGTWDKPQYDPNEMAQATGLSIAEVRARYELEKLKANPITKIIDNTKVTDTGGTGGTYTRDGTGLGGDLSTVLGLPPGVSGAGTTTVNPNGTITTRPDLSLGMKTVRDDYVAGGGNLGYTPYTPQTIEEFDTKYGSRLTGGSKQSLDYLTGKTKYSPVPYTETGEIMKPYASSVLGIPMASSNKMYLFDPATKTYKINPDYAIPTYDKEGKKSLALTNQDVINYVKSPEYSNDDAFVSWMTANNLTPEQVAAATGMPISEVYKKIKKAKPVEAVASTPVTGQNDGGNGGDGGLATGGLAAMARGGMAQQFNLGDYSDGGRLLRGPGDGVSDSIPASIGGKRPARLADGEFVVPARIVSELGNGSTEAGARKLYAMMDRIQSARRGTVGKGRVAKNSRADKYLPA
jgi:hypothetical protein